VRRLDFGFWILDFGLDFKILRPRSKDEQGRLDGLQHHQGDVIALLCIANKIVEVAKQG